MNYDFDKSKLTPALSAMRGLAAAAIALPIKGLMNLIVLLLSSTESGLLKGVPNQLTFGILFVASLFLFSSVFGAFSMYDVRGLAAYSEKRGDTLSLKGRLKYVLTERLQNGHCCMLRQSLVIVAANKDHLQLTQKVVAAEVDAAISEGLIAEDMGMIYLPDYLKAEQYVARALLSLRENRKALYGSGDAAAYADMATRQTGINYNEEQRTAISMAATEGVMILTGGPGTGKTTVIRALMRMFDMLGFRVAPFHIQEARRPAFLSFLALSEE